MGTDQATRVTLEPASAGEQELLDRMVQVYLAELSPLSGDQPDENGRFPYPYLPLYWTEEGRYPLLILSDGRVAGFALVRRLQDAGIPRCSIAEFYVMPDFRRSGVGRAAARAIFNRWPGRWHVAQMESNTAAQRFWRRVIAEYTSGCYEEAWDDDTGGPAQRFQTA